MLSYKYIMNYRTENNVLYNIIIVKIKRGNIIFTVLWFDFRLFLGWKVLLNKVNIGI